MLQFLKNRIKTSHVFWRYRHLVDPGVWQSYHADHATERRRFYANYMQREDLRSVFEFGCASGPNLRNIVDHLDAGAAQDVENGGMLAGRHGRPLIVVGYDVNRKAVEMARAHLAADTRLFVDTLDVRQLAAFLSQHRIDRFDLAIYDRVLYLLDQDTVDAHFGMVADLLEHIVVDDFHHAGEARTNGAYLTKNYVELLNTHGFELAAEEASEHPAREPFFEENARRLIFRKRG